MSHEEADPNFDTADKPYQGTSGEPQEVNAAMASALGIGSKDEEETQTPPALSDEKAQEEGQKTVENFSKAIQDASEELYGTMLYRAKNEDGYLTTLIESKDPIERKMAKKILERNKDFGASTVEDYQLLRKKEQAGDNPQAQDLIEVKHRQEKLEQKQSDAEWDNWKSTNAVSGELAEAADAIRLKYPDMDRGEIIAFARGKMGISSSAPSKPGSSAAFGGSSAPSQEDPTSSPLAKRLLRGSSTETKKFANDYLSGKYF